MRSNRQGVHLSCRRLTSSEVCVCGVGGAMWRLTDQLLAWAILPLFLRVWRARLGADGHWTIARHDRERGCGVVSREFVNERSLGGGTELTGGP